MNRTHLLLSAALLIAPFATATAASPPAPLTVKMQAPVIYTNARGARVTARYGSLSDESLHFVKLTLPGGKEYTLPLALSASGARYTDERAVVWWEHQGKARVEVRGANGDWTTKYEGLAPVNER